MKRLLVFVATIAISFFAGLQSRPKTVAAAAAPAPLPQQGCAVPKSWGTFRTGVGGSTLLFEDSSGTIRWFNLQGQIVGSPCSMITRQ